MTFTPPALCNSETPPGGRGNETRRPVMVRVPESMVTRIDQAARRLGMSRAAFMLASTIRELERTEG